MQYVRANTKHSRIQLKQLAIQFTVPLSIITLVVVTKWWYVLPVDARHTFYWGFPLACVGEGWHTSGALQFFVLEGLADILIHFLLWFVLTSIFFRMARLQRVPKFVSGTLWSTAILIMCIGGIIIAHAHPTIYLKRDYDWKIIHTGYTFVWQRTPLPGDE